MNQPPYEMDPTRREVVLAAWRERCRQQHWNILAAHVRTNHVHVVVEGEARPERIMNDLKSYASRCLNQEHISAAIRYLVDEQGQPMAVFEMVES